MLQTDLRRFGDGAGTTDSRQDDPPDKPRRTAEERQPHFMRQWRLAHGLTLKGMAAAINDQFGYKFTSQPNLSRIETGEREYRQDLLEAYAKVLNISPGMLLSRPPREDPEAIWGSVNEAMRELVELEVRRRRGG